MSSGGAGSSSVSTASVATALGPLTPFTAGFSATFAQPLKAAIPKTYPPGYAGSPRAFFNSVLTSGTSQLGACSNKLNSVAGSPCAYLDYLIYCLIVGIVVPLVTVLYCCGFLCARTCGERCRCCGSACKEPNCGGRKPTVGKYPRTQTCCCGLAFGLNWLFICVFGVLGFLSTNEAGQDIQLVLNSLNSAMNYGPDYKFQMHTRLNDIKSAALSTIQTSGINTQLATIVPDTSNSVLQAAQAIAALSTSLQSQCSLKNCPTQPPDFSTFQNNSGFPARFDQQSDGWIGANGQLLPSATCCPSNASLGTSTNGTKYTADYYPNGQLKPSVCITHVPQSQSMVNTPDGWTCCRCVEISQRLAATSSSLQQMNAKVNGLQKLIDPVRFGSIITAFGQPVNVSIDAFEDAMKQVGTILLDSSQALTNQGAVIGGSASLWTLAVISASAGIFGLLFSISCCWWTSYCLGVVNVIIFFIMFGVFALISLPFGDLCSGLPMTGDTLTIQEGWLLTFSAQGRMADLNPQFVKMYTSCMIPPPPTGNLFLVGGVDSNNISVNLNAVAGVLSVSDALAALNVAGNTLGFQESIPFIQGNFSSSASLQSSLATASSGITQLTAKASDSLAKLKDVIANRDALLGNTSSMIYSAGNCTEVNALYEGFRGPLCGRMSKSLDSVWILFFLIGIAWFPMFIIICRSAKHTLIRKGVHDNKLNEADLEIKELKQDVEEKSKDGATAPAEGEKADGGEKKVKKKKKKSADGDGAAPSAEDKQASLERKKKAK